MESYGIDPLRGNTIHKCIPDDHLVFFDSLLLHWEDEKNIYVHAGLQPGLHLSLQTEEWCLWAQDEFIYSTHDYGKRVVFGHTFFKEALVRQEKVGIDTGAIYGGNLTCFVLPGGDFITVPGQESC